MTGIFRQACAVWVIAGFMAVMPYAAGASGFFQSIDDLPVAPGMTEVADQGLAFDSPGGRIVTAVAQGNSGGTGIAAVRAFYRKALPPLGWVAGPTDIYTREGERLTLQYERAGGRTIVRVRLVPADPK